jgi:hypothetical protein
MVALRSRLLLAAAVLLTFGVTVRAPFQYDDHALLVDAAITAPGGWLDCVRIEQTRPFTFLTFWLNYQLAGDNPASYHAVNLLLHLLCVFLVLGVLRRLVSDDAAWIGAWLFALHPIQTEAVAYIWARSTLLAAVFGFASIRDWLDGRHWRSALWLLIAVLAKEEAAAIPAVILLLEWAGEAKIRGRFPLAAMFAIAIAAAGRVAWVAAHTPGSGAGSEAGVPPFAYFMTQGLAILRYLRLVALPTGFSFEPDLSVSTGFGAIAAWGGIAALAVLSFRAMRGAGVWFLMMLVFLAPTSSIFPAMDLAADRRMYMAMLGAGGLAGVALAGTRYPPLLAAGAIVLAMLSWVRAGVWQSPETLWEDAMRGAPEKLRPRLQLSRVVEPRRALEILEEARAFASDDPDLATELGRVKLQLGLPGEALTEFGKVVGQRPRDAMALNNRGTALLALELDAHAENDFRRAIRLDPCLVEPYANLRRMGRRVPLPPQCRWGPQQKAQLEPEK